jgi:hypothetical protein
MKSYLQNILFYFENVIHPAGGKTTYAEKRKRKFSSKERPLSSPESFNLRASKKQDKSRLNPAP